MSEQVSASGSPGASSVGEEEGALDPLDSTPQPGGRLTVGTVAAVRDQLMASGDLFMPTWELLARSFIQPFFAGKAHTASPAELRAAILALDGVPDNVPEDPKSFWRWIGQELLDLDHLPAATLKKLYDEASNDLAAILKNLGTCTSKIDEIARRDPRTEEDNQHTRFFEHYRAMNTEARDEIVGVLAHGIRREALRLAIRPWLPINIFHHVPWIYQAHPASYDPNEFSEVRNKLSDLSIKERREMVRLEREDKEEFSRKLEQYVIDKRPVEDLEAMITKHHVLAERREVLEAALAAYRQRNFQVFATLAAVQVEGLFEELCRELGVEDKELRIATLVPKLDALRRTGVLLPHYAYYAYRFPILRNRIAHGRIPKMDQRAATLVLLDLRDVARMLVNEPTPLNRLVTLVRGMGAEPSPPDVLRFAILLAQKKAAVPSFYAIDAGIQRLLRAVGEPSVWTHAKQLADKPRPEIDAGLRIIASGLKSQGIEGTRCKELFREIGDRGKEGFVIEEFWAAVGA